MRMNTCPRNGDPLNELPGGLNLAHHAHPPPLVTSGLLSIVPDNIPRLVFAPHQKHGKNHEASDNDGKYDDIPERHGNLLFGAKLSPLGEPALIWIKTPGPGEWA
jgi:hypothetical protein